MHDSDREQAKTGVSLLMHRKPPNFASKARNLAQCFTLMPFRPDLDELYLQTIKPIVERTRVMQCLRADEIYGPRPIMKDIWQSINASALVIADLTGRNPNVLYELGLAHAIQKTVILLTQTMDDVPFDLRQLRVLAYRNTSQGRIHLQGNLLKTLRVVLQESKGRDGLRQYTVLEPQEATAEPSRKRHEETLRSLGSKDPKVLLRALTILRESQKDDDRTSNRDPRMSATVVSLLQSPYAEVQLAAIHALGVMKERIHAPSLHPFLTSTNPMLMEASIEAIGKLRDASATSRLVDLVSDPTTQICHQAALTALGGIGSKRAITALGAILSEDGADSEQKVTAIEALGDIDDEESIDLLLSLDLQRLGTNERSTLAIKLGESESLYRPSSVKKLTSQLTRLLSDPSPEVRGASLTAWALQSFRPFGGPLDRTPLWARLCKEGDEAVSEFFMFVDRYKPVFSGDESAVLLDLARKFPSSYDNVVRILGDVGDASVAEFMIRAYKESEENQLWVLNYLSRVPVKKAVTLLRSEIASNTDTSRMTLAAVALAIIGAVDTTEELEKNAFAAYPWVKNRAKEYLAGRLQLEKSAEKQRALAALVRKLARR